MDDPPCSRSPHSYPVVYATELAAEPRPELLHLACTGHKIEDVIQQQLPNVPDDATLVTFTVGINNLHASGMVKYCIFVAVHCQNNYPNKQREIRELLPRLVDLYERVLAKAPRAKVVALTYPQIFALEGNCGLYSEPSLGYDERVWLRDRFADLDQVIDDAVRAVDSERLSALRELSAFDGHDACASTPYVNAGVVSEFDDSFHPTAAGYDRLASDLDRHLRNQAL